MSQATLSPLMQPREAQALEWYVIVDTGSLAGQRFPIRAAGGLLTLGRDASCTIKFDPEQERVVGRRHAHIELRPDGVYLVDDNSANGTFKEGQAVREVRLQHGDRFQLGGEVEGAQGPWISIHLPVAVHLTPPAPAPAGDGATLITRVNPPSRPPVPSAPLSPMHPAPELPLGLVSQPLRQPAVPPPAYVQPAAGLAAPVIAAPIAAEVVDPQQSRRRDQLIRQIASIILLLILACAAGVSLGVRQTSDQEAESDTPSK